ncbi:MAG TPA: sensor histidine kinase [bacterium]|nr:sensor histidine kinase [bacterium]
MFLNTIRVKVFAYFFLSSAFIIGIYGLVTYNLTVADLNDEMQQRLLTAGSFIISSITPEETAFLHLKGRIYEKYEGILGGFREKTGLNNIMIIGTGNKALLSLLDEPEHVIYLDNEEIEQAFLGDSTASVLYAGPGGKRFKTVYMPIKGKDGVDAVLALEASAIFTEKITKYIQSIAIAGTVILAAAFVIALLVSRGVSRSINLLKKKTEAIARRDFDETIEVKGEEEIRALAGTIESMKNELKEYINNREKLATAGEFAAGVAHEIRNSLGVLSGHAELIKEKANDEKTAKHADEIVKKTIKMSGFLNNFLLYTRDFVPEMQEVDAELFFEELFKSLEPSVQECVVIEKPAKKTVIKGDTYLLQKALYNIILNGYQAQGKEKRRIVMAASQAGGGNTEITVTDNGEGIDPRFKDKIFHPFFTGRKDGTGMGLAITYRIITEIHGGEIKADSEKGKGTVVTIRLKK